ncbi:unnamed protein product [Tilletia laevis]|uniref:Aldehyde dehydrogenase domain-containing protein n=1 Tax=Tilletia laevis TaxID=157183 RepID=A0A9N8LP43_9BASI|nr:unnamed protein product [Tilletia laevis]
MLAAHPQIRRLAFTGSTAVGRKVLETAAKTNLKKVTLELGGKGAALVFDDANLEAAVGAVAFSMSWLSGQLCMCQSRVYVQETIADKFIEAFKAAYLNTPMGDPFNETSIMGPMVDTRARDAVKQLLDTAEKEGGKLSQGTHPEGKGYYIPATVITGLPESSQLVQQEIRAMRSAKAISSGLIGINQSAPTFDLTLPFGGVRQSGLGREWGTEILDDWTEVKQVIWKI